MGRQPPGTEGEKVRKGIGGGPLAPKEKKGAAEAEEAGPARAGAGAALPPAPKLVAVEEARPKAGAVLPAPNDGNDVASPRAGVPVEAAPKGAAVPATQASKSLIAMHTLKRSDCANLCKLFRYCRRGRRKNLVNKGAV